LGASSVHSEESSLHTGESTLQKGENSLHKRTDTGSDELQQKVFSLLKGKKRASPTLIHRAILIICESDYVTVNEIAAYLRRSRETVSVHYISGMVKKGMLELKYPDTPTHPHQAYRTKGKPGGSPS
jgi:ATP-dependent DNA helicase RecG